MSRLETIIAAALYEDQWVACEKCRGVGQDENAHFWCSACNGEGCVLEPDQCAAMHDESDARAIEVVEACRVALCTDPTLATSLGAVLLPDRYINELGSVGPASMANGRQMFLFFWPVVSPETVEITREKYNELKDMQ